MRIFEYQHNMLHAKAMLVDQHHVLIGSANFDYRSFRVNFELSVLVDDAGLAYDKGAAWHDYTTSAVEILVGCSAATDVQRHRCRWQVGGYTSRRSNAHGDRACAGCGS